MEEEFLIQFRLLNTAVLDRVVAVDGGLVGGGAERGGGDRGVAAVAVPGVGAAEPHRAAGDIPEAAAAPGHPLRAVAGARTKRPEVLEGTPLERLKTTKIYPVFLTPSLAHANRGQEEDAQR